MEERVQPRRWKVAVPPSEGPHLTALNTHGTAEAIAEKAEIAAGKGDTRELFRLMRKMAPPQRLRTQTVRQCCPTTGAIGERCWTQDEELDARTYALEYIFEFRAGESLETKVDSPKEQVIVRTGFSEGPFDADDVVRAVKGLPNYKAGPNIVRNHLEQLGSGATAEVWKFCLPVITAFCTEVWNASWQMGVASPALKTSGIAFFGKAKKNAADRVNGWRIISLLSHGGKALMRCIWRQILPKVAPKDLRGPVRESPGQGNERRQCWWPPRSLRGSTRPRRGRERAAIHRCTWQQCTSTWRRLSTKWIDPQPFAALLAKARMAGLDMYLEEMHDGTYYKIRARNGQIQRQVLISKEVHQGSVKGPLIFVACYDLVVHGIQGRREAAELGSISASSQATRSGDEALVLVNEIAFVDDLLSFLIFVSWEHF